MPALHQFVWTGEQYDYAGNESFAKIEITEAPEDADWSRWGMAHTGDNYRLWCFKGTTRDTLYPFAWNGQEYQYCHDSEHETIVLTDIPEDADVSSFDVLHDGEMLRMYVKRLGVEQVLYQFAPVEGCNEWKWGENAIPSIPIVEFPEDADYCRWFMYHDADNYVYGCLIQGTPNCFVSGAFNGEAYQSSHCTSGQVVLEGGVESIGFSGASMLHDGGDYRFYFLQL